MALRIEDYALIGDCETAALVGRDGSIDWLCWPRFDSDACFAALLGNERNGRWLICPAQGRPRVSRRYRKNTLVLETHFETRTGAVTLIDFMPPRGKASDVIRRVHCERGYVAMHMELVLRFGYGAVVPWVSRIDEQTIKAVAGPDMVIAARRRRDAWRESQHRHVNSTLKKGESGRSSLTLPALASAAARAPRCRRSRSGILKLSGANGYARALPRSLGGTGDSLAHHSARADLRAHRGHCRCAHHLTAGEARKARATGTIASAGCAMRP